MYFRMSDRYIPYRSYRPEQERQDIPCHYRKKTKCLIPGAECYNEDDEVFIGRDLAHTRGYGEDVASKIDAEIKRIIDECHEEAKKIISAHKDVLDACVELLLEKEKITREEFEALFENRSGL